ncbi:MAG: hypothetical protein V3T77_05400, partial [Planctomycetota bacterium]
ESELEVALSSRVTVNGLLGMFGSRMELEQIESGSENMGNGTVSRKAIDRPTRVTVNGTLAIGMAQDFATVNRRDDFLLELPGEVQIRYNPQWVVNALEGLEELNAHWPDSGEASLGNFKIAGMASNAVSPDLVQNELAELISRLGASGDYGVDETLFSQ